MVVKIIINAPNIAEVIFNIVVYYHSFLGLIITNSDTFYLLKTCYRYVIFYALDAVLLLRFICKSTVFLKGQIVASKAYLLSFY